MGNICYPSVTGNTYIGEYILYHYMSDTEEKVIVLIQQGIIRPYKIAKELGLSQMHILKVIRGLMEAGRLKRIGIGEYEVVVAEELTPPMKDGGGSEHG